MSTLTIPVQTKQTLTGTYAKSGNDLYFISEEPDLFPPNPRTDWDCYSTFYIAPNRYFSGDIPVSAFVPDVKAGIEPEFPSRSPFPFPPSLLIPSSSLSPPPERTAPMKQFFQTDPDTRQFCRALSPTTYQFTDIVPFHSKSASPNRNYYAVAAETIDLSAYTIRQLEQAVEPYYCSLRGLVSAYGSDTTLPEILQIIAECVFENIETPKLVSPAADYPRAVSYQRQWISRQESTPGLPKTMFKSLTDSAAAS